MNKEEQNWQNFCRYHALGKWYGNWIRYSGEGDILEKLKCVRCFTLSKDEQTIYHQNFYTYSDGTTETKTFGPYQKPITSVLFLDNSFTWGSLKVKENNLFGFEIGFRLANKGASAAVMYDSTKKLERITISPECLDNFENESLNLRLNLLYRNWQGVEKSISSDLTTTEARKIDWNTLENLSSQNKIFHFSSGISLSCPQSVKKNQDILLAVDYLINDNLLQRGIRYFDSSGFTNFTLQTFSTS